MSYYKIDGVNNSKIEIIKRADTGAYVANPLGIVNADGTKMEVKSGATLAPLHAATPTGIIAPSNENQVVNRAWVDGHVTCILFELTAAIVNGVSGTGGNTYPTHPPGTDWAGTITSSYVMPQFAYVHETFFWTEAVWNGTVGAPGGPPPTKPGVYFSVGTAASGGTAPYAADFNRFGEYFQGDPLSTKTSQELKYMDQLTTAGSNLYLNIHIPNGTSNPITNGIGYLLVKIINNPRP